MSNIPRIVVAVGLGVGAGVYAVDAMERPRRPINNEQSVYDCGKALGKQAVQAVELDQTCGQFVPEFSAVSVSPPTATEHSITYKAPSSADFLITNLPIAEQKDVNATKLNYDDKVEEIKAGAIAGILVSLVAGNTIPLTYLDKLKLPARRRTKSSSQPA